MLQFERRKKNQHSVEICLTFINRQTDSFWTNLITQYKSLHIRDIEIPTSFIIHKTNSKKLIDITFVIKKYERKQKIH